MPEGPECKAYGVFLAKNISEKKLYGIDVISGRYQKKNILGLSDVCFPIMVKGITVHGKFICFLLDNYTFLFNSLGMTGSWSKVKTKHTRVVFKFGDFDICFNDQRNFGTLKFAFGRSEFFKKINSLGPDVMSNKFNSDWFFEILQKTNKTISEVLMDQTIIAGIGNYIKSESLWMAKISPFKKANEISEDNAKKLFNCIRSVYNINYNAIEYNGTNQHKILYTADKLVYNKKIDAYGNNVIKQKTPDGRNTHWVPELQKE